MSELNDEINRWESELENGTCSRDEVRELESHLREEITALVNVGLSDKEAFSVGILRLGRASEIGREYAKVAPAQVWWRRLLWTIRCVILVLPAFLSFAFSAILLAPKAQKMMEHVGLDGRESWIMEATISIFRRGEYYGFALIIAIVVMGLGYRRSSRFHRLTAGTLILTTYCAVFWTMSGLCFTMVIIASRAMG